MSVQPSKEPFQSLGKQLRELRQKMQESLAEVSGAVEIDVKMLESFEQGNERPSEDILMLLISHFGMRDDEAVTLWELAGYDRSRRSTTTHHDDNLTKQIPIMMMLSLDSRILYSDGVTVTANSNGVVVSFTQSGNAEGQITPIARIGMSHQQASNVLQTLHQALTGWASANNPKALPAPKENKKPNSDVN